MKALVTGGNGFIGRALVRRLLNRPDTELVHIVDDLSNSQKDAVLCNLMRSSKVKFSQISVNDFEPYTSYTHIFHLASPVGPAGILNFAGRMGSMIVRDTAKVAHYAIAMNAQLIDISTSEVYGKDPGENSQAEHIDKVVPSKYTVRLEYGTAKMACEVFLHNLARASGLKMNIIRPFNIIGVGQKGEVGFVLPRFVQQAVTGAPITVFGDGTQRRCFTSVEDIVSAILDITNSGTFGEIYNVGNPANVCSINALADMVVQLSGTESKIIHVDPKSVYGDLYEEAWNKIPNIDKIRRMIGWEPRFDLKYIVAEVISVERSGQ